MELSYYHQMARIEDGHWWFRGRRAVVRAFLSRHLPQRPGAAGGSPRQILDVGCGTGAMLPLLQEFGEVEGSDFSDEALGLCRGRLGDIPLHKGQLPDGLPSGRRYDVVTAFDVIEHIPDVVSALRAVRGSLAPDGVLVCTVPAFNFLWGPHDEVNHHCRRYTRALLSRHLNRAGFVLRRASYFNTLLFGPVAAVRLARKLVPRHAGAQPASDFKNEMPRFNRALEAVFASESLVVPRFPLPVGVSLIALATPRKKLRGIHETPAPRQARCMAQHEKASC